MVALFTGPIQIWLGLSDRNVGLHRRLGVIYMSAVVVSTFGEERAHPREGSPDTSAEVPR